MFYTISAMRIALISYWTCPLAHPGIMTAGGMNVYILQLSNAMAKQGHKVDIFTRSHKDDNRSIVNVNTNVRVIHLPQSKRDLYEDIKQYSKKLVLFVKKNNKGYDVIHAHYFYSGLVAIEMTKNLHIKFIMTFHTLGILKEFYGGVKDNKRIKAEKQIVVKSRGIIVSTDVEKHDLMTYYSALKEKIWTIPPGVNHILFHPRKKLLSRIKLKIDKNKKIVLFVGRIDSIKGIEFLIKSIGFLVKKYPDFKHKFLVLLIGGDIKSREFQKNREVKKIKQLIFEKDLECCVKFTSSQPHYMLPYYYSAADLVVMPSVYESFGLVVLEAMATGAAVIATRVGGLQYLITDSRDGRLFESRNIGQLAAIIWELVQKDSLRLKLGRAARKKSMQFCWDKQVAQMVQVYRDII